MATVGGDRHFRDHRRPPRPAADMVVAPGTSPQGEQLSGHRPLFSVQSTDGVSVAVHELSSAESAPPLLISHATGFCGHAYAPIASALGERYRSLAMDHRGHG